MKKGLIIILIFLLGASVLTALFMIKRHKEKKEAHMICETLDCFAAIPRYEEILKRNPGDYNALWNLARCYSEQAMLVDIENVSEGYLHKAIDYGRKAVSLNEKGYEGHLYLAEALGILLKYEGPVDRVRLVRAVKKEAETAIELQPRHYRAYLILGMWHRKVEGASWLEKKLADIFLGGVPKSSLKEAEKNLKKSIELKDNFPKTHYELAMVYKTLGNKKLAIEELERTLAGPFTNKKELELEAATILLLDEFKSKE